MYKFYPPVLVGLLLWSGACTLPAAADTPDIETLWETVQQQQQAIEQLRQKLRESESRHQVSADQIKSNAAELAVASRQLDTTGERLELAAEAIDSLALSDHQSVNIGGYGEVHYNNLDAGNELDMHRFVVFIGHEFSDQLRFFSEIEIEHSIAGNDQVGEVELEQAFVQWDYAPSHNSKAGVFLVPVGILNETHEPDTFFGVERNPVEKNLIPATWWEGGLALSGEFMPGWQYDIAAHTGLSLATGNSNSGKRTSVRSGRQKVAKATADNLAYTGRIRFTGVPGFNWGLTVQYQTDVTQGDIHGVGVSDIDGMLMETDFVYQHRSIEVRGLYAKWSFDDAINKLNPGADEQIGWYLEPSYRINRKLAVFARYSSYDLTAGESNKSEHTQLNLGLNYWLDPRFVMKLDFQQQDNERGSEQDGVNLGIGYSF